jgi:predicted DNA binding protein
VTRRVAPNGRSLHDVRAAVTGLRDLRQEIASREGDESELTDAQVKALIEAGRR